MGQSLLALLRRADIDVDCLLSDDRRLVRQTADGTLRFLSLKPDDVPTYVEYGAADMGIAGKDVLMEYGGSGLYEPLDLRIARCRLMLAGPEQAVPRGRRARVATKYVETARRYFAARGEQVEIVKLYGSMELAPLVGLADLIVDLVDSGSTLRANGLRPYENIADISSRLIVNKAAMKMKHEQVKGLIEQLGAAVARKPGA